MTGSRPNARSSTSYLPLPGYNTSPSNASFEANGLPYHPPSQKPQNSLRLPGFMTREPSSSQKLELERVNQRAVHRDMDGEGRPVITRGVGMRDGGYASFGAGLSRSNLLDDFLMKGGGGGASGRGSVVMRSEDDLDGGGGMRRGSLYASDASVGKLAATDRSGSTSIENMLQQNRASVTQLDRGGESSGRYIPTVLETKESPAVRRLAVQSSPRTESQTSVTSNAPASRIQNLQNVKQAKAPAVISRAVKPPTPEEDSASEEAEEMEEEGDEQDSDNRSEASFG
ncbi:hypothetical protein HDU98_004835, partial [Podochytrium sp. JEL0797]